MSIADSRSNFGTPLSIYQAIVDHQRNAEWWAHRDELDVAAGLGTDVHQGVRPPGKGWAVPADAACQNRAAERQGHLHL